jgi:hypothetical protein
MAKVTKIKIGKSTHTVKGWKDGTRLNNAIKSIIKQNNPKYRYFEFSHGGKTFSVLAMDKNGSGEEFSGSVSYE